MAPRTWGRGRTLAFVGVAAVPSTSKQRSSPSHGLRDPLHPPAEPPVHPEAWLFWHLLHLSPDLTCACFNCRPRRRLLTTPFLTGPGTQTSPDWRLEQTSPSGPFPLERKSVFSTACFSSDHPIPRVGVQLGKAIPLALRAPSSHSAAKTLSFSRLCKGCAWNREKERLQRAKMCTSLCSQQFMSVTFSSVQQPNKGMAA